MGDSPSAVSLTFCCCRFRCRDKSHKETRRVTNEHRSSERRIHAAADAHCRLQYDELRRRRMGRARERGGSNYSPIPPSPASGLLPQNSFCGMDTQGGTGTGGRSSDLGWLVLVGDAAPRFRLPSSSGGEQQLRRRRWQRNITKTDLLFCDHRCNRNYFPAELSAPTSIPVSAQHAQRGGRSRVSRREGGSGIFDN